MFAITPVVAIYGLHEDTETTVKELKMSGFDLKRLSIVGRDTHTDEHLMGYYKAWDCIRHCGRTHDTQLGWSVPTN